MYLRLFWEFFKTGLFAVGGGMATIPFLYDMSDKTGWFTHQDLANMIAVSESTPGPIGVNMATYVGYVTGMGEGGIGHAILGAVTATAGLVLPSLIVILIVAAMLKRFRNSPRCLISWMRRYKIWQNDDQLLWYLHPFMDRKNYLNLFILC